MSKIKVVVVEDLGILKECEDNMIWPDGNVEVFYTSAENAPRYVNILAPWDIVVVDGCCNVQLIELLSLSLAKEMIVASDNKSHRLLAMEKGCTHQCYKNNVAGFVGTLLEMSNLIN